MDFTGKRVLVTGGTRGIGRAAVASFLAAGARVAVNGRSADSVAAALEALGGAATLVAAPGDTSGVEGCRAAVEAALSGLGGLDVLVNSAGTSGGGPIGEIDEALWQRIVDTNLKGTFFCTKFAVPALREAKGAIVNLASVRAVTGASGAAVYCASKGGVTAMTRALAIELAPEVRVNALCPGYIDTEMLQYAARRIAGGVETGYARMRDGVALGRIAEPREMADAILYLASDKASYITGASILADGGISAGTLNLDQKLL